MEIVSVNMVAIFIISSKFATLALLKIMVFWNKYYDVIHSVLNVTNKISSRDSSYISDVVIYQILVTLVFSWFKFNNLRLALATALKFYTSVRKRVDTISQNVLGADSCTCRSYRIKSGSEGGELFGPSSWIELTIV